MVIQARIGHENGSHSENEESEAEERPTLPAAVECANCVYGNSPIGGPPTLALQSEEGVIHFLLGDPPDWLAAILDLS